MDDIEKLKRTLGPALLEFRRGAGLTAEQMATQVGLVPDVYGRIERGDLLPGVPVLHRLCVTFHLSAATLLGLTPEETAPSIPPPPEAPSEEVLELTLLLRELSTGDLRSLAAIATSMARDSRAQEALDEESSEEPPEESSDESSDEPSPEEEPPEE